MAKKGENVNQIAAQIDALAAAERVSHPAAAPRLLTDVRLRRQRRPHRRLQSRRTSPRQTPVEPRRLRFSKEPRRAPARPCRRPAFRKEARRALVRQCRRPACLREAGVRGGVDPLSPRSADIAPSRAVERPARVPAADTRRRRARTRKRRPPGRFPHGLSPPRSRRHRLRWMRGCVTS